MIIMIDDDNTKHLFDNIGNDKVSDGYHTMAELYDMRRALCAQLLNTMAFFEEDLIDPSIVKAKFHNDGTMYKGYFIVAAHFQGKQVSFHFALEHWDKFRLPEFERVSWKYDGHTTKDVIERLEA